MGPSLIDTTLIDVDNLNQSETIWSRFTITVVEWLGCLVGGER